MSDLYTGYLYKRENSKGFTWYYKIKAGNKVVLNRSAKTSVKKDAKKILDNTLYELEHGMSSALTPDMTLNKYLECWLEDNVKINCKYNTYDTYSKLIKEHIKNTIGIYSIKQLDTYLMQQFINSMYKNNYSKSTIETTRAMLSGAFKCAIQTYNLINVNPIQYVKIPKFSNTTQMKDKIISMEQFNQLLELCPVGSDLHICLQIGFHTGMRRGEVLALQWKNIDFDNKIIHIKHTLIKKTNGVNELVPPKTNNIRDIFIGDTLLKILKAHKIRQKENKLKYGSHYVDSDWVCTDELGNHITISKFQGRFTKLSKKLDFYFTFHMLRHTHGTMLIEAGANMKDVQARFGHKVLSTTMDIYSHSTKKMKTETVEIFETIIK